jgi:hypothetical protein
MLIATDIIIIDIIAKNNKKNNIVINKYKKGNKNIIRNI